MRELLITGGTIITINPAVPRAEAVLVRGNTIAAVGGEPAVRAAASTDARRVDLAGRTLVPGFNDAHIHLANLGMRELEIDLRNLSTGEILDRLAQAERELGAREPLVAFGWDYTTVDAPHRRVLDERFPDRPVVLIQFSGHGAWVNSAALRFLRISESTPEWEMGGPDRDPDGSLNGILREPANSPTVQRLWFARMRDRTAIRAGLEIATRRMAEYGITSVQDNSWWPRTVSELARLHRRGGLRTRVQCWSLGKVPLLDAAFSLRRFRRDWYAKGPRKFFWDGAFSSHTAWLSEPYADRPQTRGHGMSADEIEPKLRRAVRQGRQVAAHSIGDAATAAYVEALARIPDRERARALRMRIEHGQIIRDADLPRIRELGMVVSAQPHAAADPEKDRRLLGEERARRAYPYRTLLDLGIPLAFGSDYPGEATYDPLYGIHLAVNRTDEAVTPEEAITCYTAGGAYAEWEEERKGRIRPGFLADLAILSADPTTVDPTTIRDIRVEMTIVDGTVVYERAATRAQP